jgi:hypothetical protein
MKDENHTVPADTSGQRPRQESSKEGSPQQEIFPVSVAHIKLAVINDAVYGAIDPNDPSLDELARQMADLGQLEPVVVTQDSVLLSGHRRRAVALRLGWTTLNARRHHPPVHSTDPQFEQILVSYNEQRSKSPGVRIREQIVLAGNEDAYEMLLSERAKASRVDADVLALPSRPPRCKISKAKMPFLGAVQKIINELAEYWPLTDRKIFYELLNDPPLKHANKPETYINKKGKLCHNRFHNDTKSYKALIDLLTRARLAGLIPFDAIGDETRPVVVWSVYPNVGPFIREQLDSFGKGYARDLVQGLFR